MASLVYGPVPSRRLGRSLGVDIVPYKICSFDCIYCQIGRTTQNQPERKEYVTAAEVIPQVEERLKNCARPDFITLGGSGEPTLNSALADIIDGIKSITDVPVALLTNGSMMREPEIRRACAKADVIIPDLDAGDEETFRLINRPCEDIRFDDMVAGLIELREEFNGRIWLEVFFAAGINDSPEQAKKIADIAEKIRPDKIHINTVARPAAEADVSAVPRDRLEELRHILGPKAEIVADFSKHDAASKKAVSREAVLDMLKRRPCTIADVADGLNADQWEVASHVKSLVMEGDAEEAVVGEKVYFKAN